MRARYVVLILVVFAGAFAHAGRADAASIGQTNAPGLACSGPFVALQTGVSQGQSFTVPAGKWRLTTWSFSAGSDTGPVAAVVARPLGGHSYEIVAVSTLETPTANTLNVFPWSATVEGGDILGLYVDSGTTDCATETGSAGDTYELAILGSQPSPGQRVTGVTGAITVLDVSASLLPVVDDSAVTHEFVCYSRFEQDGGEVLDAATADAFVAAGRWFPYALPGNVPGGENVGAYHLSCNPPAGYEPTGQSVGDGGDVFDGAEPGAYVIDALSG